MPVKKGKSRPKQGKTKAKSLIKSKKKVFSRPTKVNIPLKAKKKPENIKKARKTHNAANILITCDPCHMGKAKAEIEGLFNTIGEELEFLEFQFPGLLKIYTPERERALTKLKDICAREPMSFETTYHYVPIDCWCKATIKDMQQAIRKNIKEISDAESWKMELNKRGIQKSHGELIVALTQVVDRKHVDLKNPEKIIRVEIIGNEAGIAIISSEELLDVPEIKKQTS